MLFLDVHVTNEDICFESSQHLKACDDIYIGGDIASFPLKMLGGKRVTIGHWQLSHAHGKILKIRPETPQTRCKLWNLMLVYCQLASSQAV